MALLRSLYHEIAYERTIFENFPHKYKNYPFKLEVVALFIVKKTIS